MSQASSEFDDLDASGELESNIFGSGLGSDDFGSSVGFEEASSSDLMDSGELMPFVYKKQGFSIYTMMLVLSFIALTATAIIMFTYAESL